MKVFVNDESKEIPSGSSLYSLLNDIGMKDFSGWAIALNEEVVPFDEIKEKSLNEGDRLILVQATQGG
jgi:thiamine biosynthesis protein ThiS